MKSWLYLINNFAHDLFTGIWCGSFIGIYTCRVSLQNTQPSPELADFATLLQGRFFILGAVALGLVMLTGVVRFWYRREWDNLEEPGKLKKPLLIIKHAILGSAFIVGSIFAVIWIF